MQKTWSSFNSTIYTPKDLLLMRMLHLAKQLHHTNYGVYIYYCLIRFHACMLNNIKLRVHMYLWLCYHLNDCITFKDVSFRSTKQGMAYELLSRILIYLLRKGIFAHTHLHIHTYMYWQERQNNEIWSSLVIVKLLSYPNEMTELTLCVSAKKQ